MVGVFDLEQFGQQVMEHAVVAVLEALVERVVGFVPAPIAPALFHFVVAAPQRQAGVVAQAAHIFDRFDADILEKVGVGRVNAAGEHEILPEQDAVAVAQIVEHILGVVTAAPDAQHVHVGIDGALQQTIQHRLGDARRERVGRNPVRALGEQAHAVDVEGEFLAPLIGFLAQFDGAQADLVGALVERRFCRLSA